MFSNFEYLKIKIFQYPNQEPVEFDKISRSECEIRNFMNNFVEENFSIYIGFFRADQFFLLRNFGQKYEVVNIS